MNDTIFREYDLRGQYPSDINENVAYTIGRSYGSYIREKFHQKKCVVSMDNRLSSPSLKNNLIKGITESGVSVIDYGLTTTPMNFFARYTENLYGVMVTASHNPKDDNGFKFSFGGHANAKGKEIEDFKVYTYSGNYLSGNGSYEQKNIFDKYNNYLKMGIDFGPKQIKVIVDPGNGAASPFIRKILSEYNLDFIIINEENDGTFPAHHPDPADKNNLVQLKNTVLEYNADLGIAFDGDADRVGFVTNTGKFLSTEEFMILIIRSMVNNVQNRKFLYDVKCSKVLEEEIKKVNAEPYLFKTGASYTQDEVHKKDLPFGGEFSGHIFFRDRIFDCGSAIYGSLRLLEILSKSDKTITELISNIPNYSITEEIKIPTPDETKFDIVNKVKEFCVSKNVPFSDIDGVKAFFDEGWVLVRASNTGPNLILRAEADSDINRDRIKNYFLNLINTYNEGIK